MLKKTVLAVVSICALPTAALADGWSQSGTITKMVASEAGYSRFEISGTGTNPGSCTSGATSVYYLDNNHPEKETIVAIALTARASNHTLRFYLFGCYTSGANTYPKIWSVEY